MADSSKKTQQRETRGAIEHPTGKAKTARVSKRTLSKKRREEQRQRLVILVAGGALGLAVLALAVGIFFDQFWVPSRPVAQVGNEVLTRREYWQEQRNALTREIVQNLQLQATFSDNPQIVSQFAGRVPAIDQQIEFIRDFPEDEQTITNWQNYQIVLQGANELGIEVSSDEINQRWVNDLGDAFLPSPITTTETLTPTAELTATTTAEDEDAPTVVAEDAETAVTAVAATTTVTPTQTPTQTPGGPTLTPTETSTPAPTDTPRPTPVAAVANEQASEIMDGLFETYTTELEFSSLEPSLTEDDFRETLQRFYREQVLTRKLREELQPEADFTPNEEPDRIAARHILLQVDVPEDADQEEIDAAFAEREEEAEALVAELRDGADFAELAAEESEDPGSRDSGGDVGFFDAEGFSDAGGSYDPDFVAAAFALEGDEISDPVRTQFGWHIIQVTEREVPTAEEQLQIAQQEAFDTWIEEQREALAAQRIPAPTETATLPGVEEPIPTETPVFLPGPPTIAPTSTPEPTPTVAPTDDVVGPDLSTETPEENPTP